MKRPVSDRSWYRIANVAEGGPSRVDIYDEIGDGGFLGGVSASAFTAELAAIDGDLEVHINSPGGSVFDGLAIYNAIANRPGNVTTVIDGLAASAASFIAQAGRTRVISPGAMVMIHDAMGLTIGNAEDMRETADLLDKASDNIAGLYAAHSGRPVDGWRQAMQAETWYTADEAVASGLADRLAERPASGEALELAASYASVFAKVPDWTGVSNAIPEPVVDEFGHPLLDWDGSAAMSAAAKSDDPAAAYRAICAGRRAGDPGKQSSWALPHHPHPGDPPDADGVRNALARLPQTQGLTNANAAEAHLKAHLAAVSPDNQHDHAGGLPAWIAALPDATKEAAGR